MSKPKFCPYCMSGDLKEGVGTYVEMGEWDGNDYESEGSADGWRCNTCGGEFWVSGPEMPAQPEEEKPEPPKLPLNLKSMTYDLRGPAGNGYAVQGSVIAELKKINPEWAKEYDRRLAENPVKTYENLLRISREFVEFNWIGLPEETIDGNE